MPEVKRILLTGGSSFIGRNILEDLLRDPQQYIVDAPTHQMLDLLDERQVQRVLEQGRYDIVLHSAMYNEVFDHPDMLESSVRMFANLERCSEAFGRCFYFGSGAEFDKTLEISNVAESDLGRSIPKNRYGLAKYIMARMAQSNPKLVNLRLFGVYGKYEDWKTKFISNASCRALKGMPITISQNVVFDYLYIDDLCKIVRSFMDMDLKYSDYNIVSGSSVDLLSIAEHIAMLAGDRTEIRIYQAGFKPEYTAQNHRLLKELDVQFTSWQEGVNRLFHWYRKSIQEIDGNRL